MTRPGVVITSRADIPPRSAPTASDAAFMVGKTASGTDVARVTSMSQYVSTFGVRTGATDTYDNAESYFREGGSKLTVSPAADATGLDAALDLLTKDLGPGQVFVPGALGDDDAVRSGLLAHAAEKNRIALLHTAPDADVAELSAIAATLTADANARYGALFAPGGIFPGVTASDLRAASWDGAAAGIIARNDAQYGPNDAAAGAHGLSRFAVDVAATFVDADRETLNGLGVNLVRSIYGQVQNYGYRTPADPDTGWGLLSNARLNMAIVAQLEAVAERYVFAQLDGRRVKINQFGADLVGVLVPFYESGQLYGTTAQEAFYVDVGQAVNTDATIAAGELHAVVGVRMSPFAELVEIEIVKVAADQPLLVAA
jgi:hypothetical protein